MGDEYYLDPYSSFGNSDDRYYDYGAVIHKPQMRPQRLQQAQQSRPGGSAYAPVYEARQGRCRAPTKEVPKDAFPYPFTGDNGAMKNVPSDSEELFSWGKYGGIDGNRRENFTIDGAVLGLGNINMFMFVFIMLIFICMYSMYGIIKIQKEMAKLKRLLERLEAPRSA